MALSASVNGGTTTPAFLHFPIIVNGIGIFHSFPKANLNGANLNLTWARGLVVARRERAHVPTRLISSRQCVLNDIYTGRVTNWNDASIVSINPAMTVVSHTIIVGYRSDGSGTSGVFSSWLGGYNSLNGPGPACGSTVNFQNHPFAPGVGQADYLLCSNFPGCSVYPNSCTSTLCYNNNQYLWSNIKSVGAVPPTGVTTPPGGVQGTAGMLTFVASTAYALGYADNGQGLASNLQEAAVLNPSGSFVQTAAANLAYSLGEAGTLPNPDGSTKSNPTPNNNAWPQLSLFDATPTNSQQACRSGNFATCTVRGDPADLTLCPRRTRARLSCSRSSACRT